MSGVQEKREKVKIKFLVYSERTLAIVYIISCLNDFESLTRTLPLVYLYLWVNLLLHCLHAVSLEPGGTQV